MMETAIVIASDKHIQELDIGLLIHADTPYEEWAAYGKTLAKRYSGIQWQIGDWINAGEALYGEMYVQAVEETRLTYGTLRNYASICARIPQINRNPKLLFHQAKHVACLEPIEQRKILDFAAAHNMTGDDILEAVQRITKQPPKPTRIEGEISRHYKQEDGDYLVIRMSSDHDLQTGQMVILKAKES